MDSVVLLAFRIGLLVLLWFFRADDTSRITSRHKKQRLVWPQAEVLYRPPSPAKPSIVSCIKKSLMRQAQLSGWI